MNGNIVSFHCSINICCTNVNRLNQIEKKKIKKKKKNMDFIYRKILKMMMQRNALIIYYNKLVYFHILLHKDRPLKVIEDENQKIKSKKKKTKKKMSFQNNYLVK